MSKTLIDVSNKFKDLKAIINGRNSAGFKAIVHNAAQYALNSTRYRFMTKKQADGQSFARHSPLTLALGGFQRHHKSRIGGSMDKLWNRSKYFKWKANAVLCGVAFDEYKPAQYFHWGWKQTITRKQAWFLNKTQFQSGSKKIYFLKEGGKLINNPRKINELNNDDKIEITKLIAEGLVRYIKYGN